MTIDPNTGHIVKAAADKAERQIRGTTTQPCTVLRVDHSDDAATAGTAWVQVDGDPVDEPREVALTADYTPKLGDRAQVTYTPPFGAYLIPGNTGNVDPAGAVNSLCGASSLELLTSELGTATFCCEEFTVGGMSSNAGTTLLVPLSGIYGVRFEAHFTFTDTLATPGNVSANMLRTSDAYVMSSWYGKVPPTWRDPSHLMTIILGRDAVPLPAGDSVYITVFNGDTETLILNDARLDISWRAPYDGTTNICSEGGG